MTHKNNLYEAIAEVVSGGASDEKISKALRELRNQVLEEVAVKCETLEPEYKKGGIEVALYNFVAVPQHN